MLAANLGLRFLLELAAFTALGVLGAHVGGDGASAVLLAVAFPVAGMVVWGAFVAPRAPVAVPAPAHAALQVLVFGGAAIGLAVSGSPVLGVALAGLAALNAAALGVLEP